MPQVPPFSPFTHRVRSERVADRRIFEAAVHRMFGAANVSIREASGALLVTVTNNPLKAGFEQKMVEQGAMTKPLHLNLPPIEPEE